MAVITVTLNNGGRITGEHVGTAEGYVYLCDGDSVLRIEQRLIVSYVNEEAL